MIYSDSYSNLSPTNMTESAGDYAPGTNEVAPAGGGGGSGAMGQAGFAMQIAGEVLNGAAAIRKAKADIKNADRDYFAEMVQIYDTYEQVFDELKEGSRRMFATQNVAVATSGLASEGSMVTLLDEAVFEAEKQRSRYEDKMNEDVFSAHYKRNQRVRQAKREKKWSLVTTGLKLGAAAFGFIA